jgi:hypothetical protein
MKTVDECNSKIHSDNDQLKSEVARFKALVSTPMHPHTLPHAQCTPHSCAHPPCLPRRTAFTLVSTLLSHCFAHSEHHTREHTLLPCLAHSESQQALPLSPFPLRSSAAGASTFPSISSAATHNRAASTCEVPLACTRSPLTQQLSSENAFLTSCKRPPTLSHPTHSPT